MDFKFLEVDSNDKELLEKVYAFRYKIVTTTEIFQEYVDNNDFSSEKESDIFDKYSVHFTAIDKQGDVCATVRLIYKSPIGYPTEHNAKFDNTQFEREKLGEMSRIFIDPKYRNIKTTKYIIDKLKDLMFIKLKQEGIEYTYGVLEENFLRLLKIYKLNYHTIGELQVMKNFGLRYPCVLYTDEFGKDNPWLIKLWEDCKNA